MTTLSQDCLINEDNSFFLFENPPSGTDTITGNLIITNNLNIGESLDISGNLNVGGSISTDANLSAQGNVVAVGDVAGNNFTVKGQIDINGNINIPVYSNSIPQPVSGPNNFILGFGALIPNPINDVPFCTVLYSGASSSDYVFLTRNGTQIAPESAGVLTVGARIPGVGFTVFSSSPLDVPGLTGPVTFNYLIIKGNVQNAPSVNTATYNYPENTGLPVTFTAPTPSFAFIFNSTEELLDGTIIEVTCSGLPTADITSFYISPPIPLTTVTLTAGVITITLGSTITSGFTLSIIATEDATSVDSLVITPGTS